MTTNMRVSILHRVKDIKNIGKKKKWHKKLVINGQT